MNSIGRIVPSEGPTNAKLFIVGEAPGEKEEALGRPFIGASGSLLNRMLSQAGISRASCRVGNVAKARPQDNKIEHFFLDKKKTKPIPELEGWILELKAEIEACQPNVILALGATALWALCGTAAIKAYRGTVMECKLVPGVKVIPTYHPAFINRMYENYFPSLMDIRKAVKHLQFPGVPKDNRQLFVDASPQEFITWCKNMLTRPPENIAIDIEIADGPGAHISWVGFAVAPAFAINVKFIQATPEGYIPNMSEDLEHQLWVALDKLLTSNHKFILHNAQFDASILYKNNSILIKNIYMDTMLATHACWLGLPKSLGFVSSICLDVPAWKHTAKDDMGEYNALDCINTLHIAEYFERELKVSGTYDIYLLEMSELPVAMMFGLQGVRVNLTAKDEMFNELTAKKEKLTETLNLLASPAQPETKINWASPKQVATFLYNVLGFPAQFKRKSYASDAAVQTTDEDAMDKLASIAHTVTHIDPIQRQIPKLVIELRKVNKLLSTYLTFDTDGDRIYAGYNIAATDTGRWSSSKSIFNPFGPGNMQNIPEVARKIYVP